MRGETKREDRVCPWWRELATDFLCVYPQRGYCLASGRRRPRFPGRATVSRKCTANFELCEGFTGHAEQPA